MQPSLAKLKSQIERLTCDCDQVWIRQQLQAMQIESADPVYRAQIAEILRFGCTSENVIRGYNGHFAGCMGGGGQTVHTQEIHTRGGMKNEIDLHAHEQGAKAFTKAHGAAAYKKVHDALEAGAKAGATKLSAADKAILKADLKATVAKAAALEAKGRDASHFRAEALMLTRQLGRAGAKTTGAGKAKGESSKTGAGKDRIAALHETSARLHAEAAAQGTPLAPEVKPGSDLAALKTSGPGQRVDPWGPRNPYQYISVYGEHQLGRALSIESMESLRATASAMHIDKMSSSKAGLLSQIVATATKGRYSANFSKTTSASKGRGAQRTSAADLLRLRINLARLAAPEYAVQLADIERFACANPIFGYHHYFAGCADGGGGNKAVVRAHIADHNPKTGEEKSIAGMKHEVDLHEFTGRGKQQSYDAAHMPGDYQKVKADLEAKALAAAQKMTPEERSILSDHLDRINAQAARLNSALIHEFDKNPNASMHDPHIRSIDEQLNTRRAEAEMLSAHLSRAQDESDRQQARIDAYHKSVEATAQAKDEAYKAKQDAKAAAAKSKSDAKAAQAQARQEREKKSLAQHPGQREHPSLDGGVQDPAGQRQGQSRPRHAR